MRSDLAEAVGRSGGRPGPRALESLRTALLDTERVLTATIAQTPRTDLVAALTDARLVVAGAKVNNSYPLDELRGAVTYLSGPQTVFLPLLADDVAEPFFVPAGSGVAFAAAVREAVAARRPIAPDPPLWEDTHFTSVLRLAECGLLAAPPHCPIEPRVWLVGTITSVGVILRAKEGTARHLIPWKLVQSVRVEGVDQVTDRLNLGAVIVFGVLGLAARQIEKRAFLALETTAGDYLLEDDEHLPVELRALLAPFLDRLGLNESQIAPSAPADDPIEQIRRLGELRDAGYITPEQFATKRAELLDRI